LYVPDIVEGAVEPGVNVTLQLADGDRLQLAALKVPAPPVEESTTEPAGFVPPAPFVSTTVTVQVEAWLIGTVEGAQTTVVEVDRRVPVAEPLVEPLLALPA
jgi:hypothetical protein